MLRRFFGMLGVDYDQYRALVRTSLKLDFRLTGIRSSFQQQSEGSPKALLGLLIIGLLSGVVFGIIAWRSDNVFFSGTLFVTYILFQIGALVLMDFHTVVISPDDAAILGYHPISSRTFFFARFANALFYTSLVTTAMGIIPIGAYLLRGGFSPLLGLAAILATYLSAAGVTLAMILVYAAVLRWVHPNRMRRALSYLQLVMSFLVYGGYMLLPELIDRRTITTMTLPQSPFIFLHPATWFASYLDLAAGHWSASRVLAALASLAALWAMLWYAAGKLSLEYSDRLSALTAVSEGPKKAVRASPAWRTFFKRDEPRAVALLVRNQFKYDQKFRMGVISILPLTLFYLYMGLRDGPIPDPFLYAATKFQRSILLYLAVLLFPMMLKTILVRSDSFQASWIFFATPANKALLVRSVKSFVMVYFVAPYLLFLAAIFGYYFRNLLHVAMHVMVLAMISHLFLQISVLIQPELPFSQPVKKGERFNMLVFLMTGGSAVALGILPLLFRWVYPNSTRFVIVLAAIAGVSWVLEKALWMRIERLTRQLQYSG